MRKLAIIAAALALPLGGCETIPTGPGTIADQTVLDEKAGIGAETLYLGANRAAALAIRTGLVSDQATIKRIGELDVEAKMWLQRVRDAYDASNAANYDAAFRRLNTIANEMLVLAQ